MRSLRACRPRSSSLALPALTALSALAALLGGAVEIAAQHQEHSPYAGSGSSEVKTLTQEEVDDLLAAEGMGYARAAELNGYPGPRHVLDLADALELTLLQRTRTNTIFAHMQMRARQLGREIVDGEIALDSAFAAGGGSGGAAAELEALVERLAALEGQLRWVHLSAHLQVAELLTEAQRQNYDRLRGYEPAAHGGH